MKKYLSCMFSVLLISFAFVPTAKAATVTPQTSFLRDMVIDQKSDKSTGNQIGLSDSISFFSPIGQEFVPSKSVLVGVSVYVRNLYTNDTTLVIKIRKNTIDGPIVVGKSVFVPNGFVGWKTVLFSHSANLKTGDRYVIQVQPTDPKNSCGLVSNGWPTNTYPYGRWILRGLPDASGANDFAFRTYTLKTSK